MLSRDIYGLLVQNLHREYRSSFHDLLFVHGGTLQDEEFSTEAASNPCSLGNSNFIRVDHSDFPTGVLRDMGPFVSRESFRLTNRDRLQDAVIHTS